MNKILQTVAFLFLATCSFAQSGTTDFVPGYNVIFEDNFEIDPVGDFPARWNTSGDGQVVTLDDMPGKWLKISQPTAVCPELKKALPEDCTIEFDVYLKSTSAVAPVINFGLTSLSDVSTGDVYRRQIFVKMMGYNESGSIVYGKNIQDMGEKKFDLEGYVNRALHVSMSLNKTRWRVYLDGEKVVDLPKLLTPDFRKNFYIASSVIVPAPEEGVYISNVRIAAGDADARSLLIKQLMEQGSVTTSDIQFSQTNQITPESQPVVDQLGQVLQQNPDMSIQINSVQEVPTDAVNPDGTVSSADQAIAAGTKALKLKADKIKAYLVNKFKVKLDRIVTDVKVKATDAAAKNKTAGQAKQLMTEIIKL